jgi:transketolase C-terminal domain/subunit
MPVPVNRLGIQDRYGESARSDQLLGKCRLSAARVAEDVERLLRFLGRQKG